MLCIQNVWHLFVCQFAWECDFVVCLRSNTFLKGLWNFLVRFKSKNVLLKIDTRLTRMRELHTHAVEVASVSVAVTVCVRVLVCIYVCEWVCLADWFYFCGRHCFHWCCRHRRHCTSLPLLLLVFLISSLLHKQNKVFSCFYCCLFSFMNSHFAFVLAYGSSSCTLFLLLPFSHFCVWRWFFWKTSLFLRTTLELNWISIS